MNDHRRGFVSRLTLGLLAGVALPRPLHATPSTRQTFAPAEAWLDGLTGKHKQFFDVGNHSAGGPLLRADSFLGAYRQAYGLEESHVNIVFGAHGSALALVLGDALWTHYKLGAHYSIEDPLTKQPAERNVYSGAGGAASAVDTSVTSLQKRGVRFLGCMQSIARLARPLSAKSGESEAAVRETLLAGLLPGVTAVPAMIVAANRAQESGLTYAYLG
jgi:intracellular sulfur oxidation DsrE/DsrF family protein